MCCPARISTEFFHLFDSSEFESRTAERRVTRHPVSLVLLGRTFDVEAEFGVELALDGGPGEQSAEAMPDVT